MTTMSTLPARDSQQGLDPLVDAREDFLDFLERRLGDRDRAEDLLQAAFVRAAEHLTQLREHESITAWFYRILRNAVIDHWRMQERRSQKADALAYAFGQSAEPTADTEAAVCQCVARLVDTLKPEYAEALRNVDLAGVPVKDYAARSQITPNLAGVRLFRAREALRRQVVRCCGGCAEEGCNDCHCSGE